MGYDIDTDFAAILPFELRQVPRLSHVGAHEFNRMARGAAVPAIIEDAATWPAAVRWRDPERLVELVGADTEVFCRQVADPAAPYEENYEALTFGQLIHEVFEVGSSRNYLTQGLLFPPVGFFRRLARSAYPALLDALAADCEVPAFIDAADLLEGVIWLGVGGQVTPLHFDEPNNLNVVLRGRKRWLLFPPSEIRNLCVDGNDARGSVVSSIEQLTDGERWRGGDVRCAYLCETGPGDMLYVPSGYLHQVYSSDEPSIAVNFWFIDLTSPAEVGRVLRSRTTRRMGIHQPAKRIVYGALLVGATMFLRFKYLLRPSSMPVQEFDLGPTGYKSVQGL